MDKETVISLELQTDQAFEALKRAVATRTQLDTKWAEKLYWDLWERNVYSTLMDRYRWQAEIGSGFAKILSQDLWYVARGHQPEEQRDFDFEIAKRAIDEGGTGHNVMVLQGFYQSRRFDLGLKAIEYVRNKFPKPNL